MRDIDELTFNQQEKLDQQISQLEKFDNSNNTFFVKIQSILLQEQNRNNNFERTNGESFEYTLDQAVQIVKEKVICFKFNEKRYFDADCIKRI